MNTPSTSQEVVEELAEAVVTWWEKHQYDCAGDRNLYDEPPAFVKIAHALLDLPEPL